MSTTDISEFALQLTVMNPPDEAQLRSREDRVLGLRGKLEYFYSEMKRQQQKDLSDQKAAAQRETAQLLDMLRIADSFEDVFRMAEENKSLRKQSAAIDAFRTTYETVLDVLERRGVFRVEILGKSYDNVVFQTIAIPEPWKVVSMQSPNEKSRVVRQILRSLWVRVVDKRVSVLRRGEVTY